MDFENQNDVVDPVDSNETKDDLSDAEQQEQDQELVQGTYELIVKKATNYLAKNPDKAQEIWIDNLFDGVSRLVMKKIEEDSNLSFTEEQKQSVTSLIDMFKKQTQTIEQQAKGSHAVSERINSLEQKLSGDPDKDYPVLKELLRAGLVSVSWHVAFDTDGANSIRTSQDTYNYAYRSEGGNVVVEYDGNTFKYKKEELRSI